MAVVVWSTTIHGSGFDTHCLPIIFTTRPHNRARPRTTKGGFEWEGVCPCEGELRSTCYVQQRIGKVGLKVDCDMVTQREQVSHVIYERPFRWHVFCFSSVPVSE